MSPLSKVCSICIVIPGAIGILSAAYEVRGQAVENPVLALSQAVHGSFDASQTDEVPGQTDQPASNSFLGVPSALKVADHVLVLNPGERLSYHHTPSALTAIRWTLAAERQNQKVTHDGTSRFSVQCTFRDYRGSGFAARLTETNDEQFEAVFITESSGMTADEKEQIAAFTRNGRLRSLRNLEVRYSHGYLSLTADGDLIGQCHVGTMRHLISQMSIGAESERILLERVDASVVPMKGDAITSIRQYESDLASIDELSIPYHQHRYATVIDLVKNHNRGYYECPEPGRAGFFARNEYDAGMAAVLAGQSAEACKHFDAIERIPPDFFPLMHFVRQRTLLAKAIELRKAMRHKESAAVYAELIPRLELLLGLNHSLTIHAQVARATLLVEMQKAEEAERLLAELDATINWEVLNDPELRAVILNNIAFARADQGDDAGALAAMQKMSEVLFSQVGAEEVMRQGRLVNLLLSLAGKLDRSGNLLEAESWYRQVYGPDGETDAALGRLDPGHLANYAVLLARLGQTGRSLALFESALRQMESESTPQDRARAATLSNMATQISTNGDVEQAIAKNAEAIEILETQAGPDHPDLLFPLRCQADFYARIGNYTEAQSFLDRGWLILSNRFPKCHPETVHQSIAQAYLFLWQNKPADALRALRSAEEYCDRFFYSTQDSSILFRSLLARTLLLLKEPQEAELVSNDVIRNLTEVSAAVLPTRSESGARLCIRSEERLPFVAIAHVSGSAESIHNAYQHHWDLNARVSRFRALKLKSTEAAAEYDRLVRNCAALFMASAPVIEIPNGGAEPAEPTDSGREDAVNSARRLHSQRIEASRIALEQFQSVYCRDSEQSLQMQKGKPNDLLAVLKPNVAVVDFVKSIEPVPFTDDGRELEAGIQRAIVRDRYDAFILSHGGKDQLQIRCIPLGPAELIDNLAEDLHSAINVSAPEEECSRLAAALGNAVWKPLQPHVNDMERIVIIPAGSLNLVPWNLLPVGDGAKQLIDRHTISIAEFAQQLCIREETPPGNRLRLTVVGDVDYEPADLEDFTEGRHHKASGKERLLADAPPFVSDPLQIAPLTRDGMFGHWAPLPGSRKECRNLIEIFSRSRTDGDVVQLSGHLATPSAVLESARSATHLHLAIHAFFLSDQDSVKLSIDPRQTSLVTSESGSTFSSNTLAVQNPLLLSGLVLSSGRKYRDSAGDLADAVGAARVEDGIVLAEQIAGLDFADLQLVTLSGCETGVGESVNGDVAAGLRSAFHRAGARRVISSLWKVDDQVTSELMSEFYRNVWERGQDCASALRNAQLMVRDEFPDREPSLADRGIDFKQTVPVPDSVRTGNRTDLRLWAGFQLSGNPF